MTIIERIKQILKSGAEVSLQNIYEHMSEHTPASIRGNLNRYILNGNADIQRVKRECIR